MKLFSVLISTLLLLNTNAISQMRVINGKVIDEKLNPILYINVKINDSIFPIKTDTTGQFRLSIPNETKTLKIGEVGFEWSDINLTEECNQIEIVLLSHWIYDFISIKKADKLRRKQFKKLPNLHSQAFKKGIFSRGTVCYNQNFVSYYNKKRRK